MKNVFDKFLKEALASLETNLAEDSVIDMSVYSPVYLSCSVDSVTRCVQFLSTFSNENLPNCTNNVPKYIKYVPKY